MEITSALFESGIPVTPQFRQALRTISKFFEANKFAPSDDYFVRSSIQAQVIELSKRLRRIRKLRVKWVAEADQNLNAFYHQGAERALKKAIDNYQRQK